MYRRVRIGAPAAEEEYWTMSYAAANSVQFCD